MAVSQSRAQRGLYGRAVELQLIDNRLRAARAGHGGFIVLTGPPGIGKTALLDLTEARARERRFQVLRAAALESRYGAGFGVIRRALQDPLAAAERAGTIDELLSGSARFARPILDLPDAPAGMPDVAKQRFGLYCLLTNLTDDRPLAVLLDDMQWADDASYKFLSYIAPRLPWLPMLVLMSARFRRENMSLELAKLFHMADSEVIELAALDLEAAGELFQDRLGRDIPAEFRAEAARSAHGNPFRLTEMARRLLEMPRSLLDESAIRSVGREVALDAAARPLHDVDHLSRRLAVALAVLGESSELREAAELADLPLDDAAHAATALTRAGILEDASPLTFRHALLRESILRQLDSEEAGVAHRRAAELLIRLGAPRDRIAGQILDAPPGESAVFVEVLKEAAQASLTRGAPAAGIGLIDRALRENPAPGERGELLLTRALAGALLSTPEAIGDLRGAEALLATPEARATCVLLRGRLLVSSGRVEDGLTALADAADLMDGVDPDLALIAKAELLAAMLVDVHLSRSVEDHVAALRTYPSQTATKGTCAAAAVLAVYQLLMSNGPATAAADLARAALRDGLLANDPALHLPFYYVALLVLIYADDVTAARTELDRAVRWAQATRSVSELSTALSLRGVTRIRTGDVVGAQADASRTLMLAAESQMPLGLMWGARAGVEACLHRGEFDRADELLAGTIRISGPHVEHYAAYSELLFARARLHAARGEPEAAIEALQETGRHAALWHCTCPSYLPWRSELALRLKAQGRSEEAAELAAHALELAEALGSPRAIAIAKRAAVLTDPDDPDVDSLAEIAAVLAGAAPLESARTLVELGRLLARTGEPKAAREPLYEALKLAETTGSVLLGQHALHALRACGARPRRTSLVGPAALTPSERKVVDLAVEGRTNREIAQVLVLSQKTVEDHLRRSFGKLGVRSREELPAALRSSPSPIPVGEPQDRASAA